ncbi:MAG TPA: nitroreductase family protein [Burkholderiaceae bacterium]
MNPHRKHRMPTSDLSFGNVPIALPPPQLPYLELQFAFQVRRSTRELLPDALTLAEIGCLLWSAGGINRQVGNGRTAPSALGWNEVDIYAVTAQGAWLYDALEHGLLPVAAGDLRSATGEQAFCAEAPLNFVYVADDARMQDARPEQREFLAAVTAGAMAQNAYLAAAAFEMGSVVRAMIDRPHLGASLNLPSTQHVLLGQTFGWPRRGDAV